MVECVVKKLSLCGFEVDDAARVVVAKVGFVDRYFMCIGHSLDTRRWGDGPDLDDIDIRDDRFVLPCTGYVIESGIYLAGAFGICSSIDVLLASDGVHVTPEPSQAE